MSPFADALRRARFKKGIRQQDLADLMGCERSYVSALENDLKLAPPGDFVERLSARLELTVEEADELQQARIRSRRRYDIPADVPPAAFEFLHELFGRLDHLSEQHLVALGATLKLGQGRSPSATPPEGRLRRRDRKRDKGEVTG